MDEAGSLQAHRPPVPKVQVPPEQGGSEATVIAWIWARTVKCPNLACGCEMPLVRSFELSKKKGKEPYVYPICDSAQVSNEVRAGKGAPEGTLNRKGATCLCCGTPAGFPYIRDEGKAGRMGSKLIAIVAEGRNGWIYISPSIGQIQAADVDKPGEYPDGELFGKAAVNVSNYGLTNFSDLFNNRQLTALTSFSALAGEAQVKAEVDALAAGMADDGIGIADGDTGAKAYGQAVGIYLANVVDRLADFSISVSRWSISN